MKRNILKILLIVIVSSLLISVLNYFFPTYKQREKDYYSERDNFVSVTGVVTDIKYFDDGQICIYVRDKSVDFVDTGFVLKGQNAIIAIQNGIEDKLNIGCTIEFTCAPRYFGDGYKIPLVSLGVEDNIILDFEVGFTNLLAEYS